MNIYEITLIEVVPPINFKERQMITLIMEFIFHQNPLECIYYSITKIIICKYFQKIRTLKVFFLSCTVIKIYADALNPQDSFVKTNM